MTTASSEPPSPRPGEGRAPLRGVRAFAWDLWRRATWRVPRWRTRGHALLRAIRHSPGRGLAEATRRFRSEIRVGGVAVPLGAHMSDEIVIALALGTYERPERRVMKATLEPDDVVMELGTGIGFLTTHCARRIGSDRVFTFEANPMLERHIRATFARNGVAPTLRMCMLGERGGTAQLYVHPSFWGSSTVARFVEAPVVDTPVEPFAAALAAIRPTFLVVDIEGGEAQLLAHADLSGVRKICLEVHPWAIGEDGTRQVLTRLEAAGFSRSGALSTDTVWFMSRAS